MNPFIEYDDIDQQLIHSLEINIAEFVKKCIDTNVYVNLDLNEYYIPDRDNWNKKPYDHENLIFGYDNNDSLFHIMGYKGGKPYYSKVTYDDFLKAYSGCTPPVFHERNKIELIRYNYCDFQHKEDINAIHLGLSDYLTSYDSRTRNRQIIQNDLDLIFGISIYDCILSNNENMKYFFDDIRISHFLMEHKKLMKQRVCFLFTRGYIANCDYIDLSSIFEEIYETSLTVRNLVLRNLIQGNVNTSSKICSLMIEMEKKEQKGISNLIKAIENT